MATSQNHYQTLDVQPDASQAQIKQAYRRLAKKFHPDTNSTTANHDKISQINAAYEVLSDPQHRQNYDQALQLEAAGFSAEGLDARQQRTAAAQAQYRKQRQEEQDSDSQLRFWLNRIYTPVNRTLNQIMRPLKSQINELSADPFDDQLMENFHSYIEDCRDLLSKAQRTFRSQPNPPIAARAAASLYHCLNQLGDGIEELEYFTQNYDDHHLHTGRELFRIAEGLRRDAMAAIRELPR